MTKVDQRRTKPDAERRTIEPAAAHGVARFSTDALPPSERLAYLREEVGRNTRLDLSPVAESPLKWAARMYLFDGLTVISGETSGLLARRTRSLVADGDDGLVFTTNRSGLSRNWQLGRECRIGAGSAVLLTRGDPGGQHYAGLVNHLILRIPRQRLSGLIGTPEDRAIRPIHRNTEALRLLLGYVEAGVRRHRLASPALRHLFATHVHDLVALAIGASRDAAELAHGRSLSAARLNAAQSDIISRLAEEGLTVASVAGRLGVTPRYLQRLFEAEGTTFSEYVTLQRLARARRMLTDPRFLDRTVASIAFDVGFGNLSHFNRLFRRSYGATPSDVRAGARDPTPQND